jgi:hypothetical protein
VPAQLQVANLVSEILTLGYQPTTSPKNQNHATASGFRARAVRSDRSRTGPKRHRPLPSPH